MFIYTIQRNQNEKFGYDEAFGFVVIAENEGRARLLAGREAGDEGALAWVDTLRSDAELIGTATKGAKSGVVLRDFHAG